MDTLRWFNIPAGKVIVAGVFCFAMIFPGLATAQTCPALKVTAHPDYAPFSWNTGSSIDGVLVRVIDRFSRQTRVPVTMEPSKTLEEALNRANAGDVDLILGLYRTPHREAELQFVNRPVTTDPIGLFVRQATADEIDELDDLKGLRGAATVGESFGADFDLRIAKQLTLFRTETLNAAMKFLVDKQADYVLSGLYPGLAHLRQLGAGHGIALTQAALIPPQQIYVAFSRKSPCLGLAGTLESVIERATARGDIEGLIAEAMMRWNQTPAK